MVVEVRIVVILGQRYGLGSDVRECSGVMEIDLGVITQGYRRVNVQQVQIYKLMVRILYQFKKGNRKKKRL